MGDLSTPDSVQKLQTALHAKAKAEPVAAARPADNRHDIGRRALPDLLEQLRNELLPAEEEAGVLLAEGEKAAIGREAREQLFGGGDVDRLTLPAWTWPNRRSPPSGRARASATRARGYATG